MPAQNKVAKKKILIVDDERYVSDVLNKKLSKAGYEVFKMSSGEEVFLKARELMPDLILLDIMLGEIDGMKIKQRLNEELKTASIPVIFLTAKGMTQDKIKGLGLGADDYITKPFILGELLARVKSVLTRRKLYEEIAMTDGLTKLYNVHFFKKQFSIFFNMAKRYGHIFTLVIIDVNDFKPINDTCGHIAGDFVLKKIAAMLKEGLRKADIVTRYGGDEFAVLLPGCDEKNAVKIMDKIKKKIKSQSFTFEDTVKKLSCSISVGLAVYSDKFTGETELFKAADSNMYQDKRKHKEEKKSAAALNLK